MTWKEFKEEVEKQGVKDGDVIYGIDVWDLTHITSINCTKDEEDGEWEITG